MKLVKKLLGACALVLGGMSAVSCASSADFTVGVCQLIKHEALDAATQGFIDTLQAEMKAAGKTVKIDLQNASGEPTTCTTIINKFVSKKADLIMANATPALQAAASGTETIPVLGTSITEYGVALDIKDFTGVVGSNVSGTSDLAPLDEQAQMILDFVPTATDIGILYCSSEANSKYQADVVKAELAAKGKTVHVSTFTETNDLTAVLTELCTKVQAIYVPTDNTCAANASTIDSITRAKNIPVLAGEEGICRACGVGTISISYYNIGVKTGKMAADILLRGADVKTMAIQYDENPVKLFNAEICQALGITAPAGYTAMSK